MTTPIVTYQPDNAGTVDGIGSGRRLQALAYMGHSVETLAERLPGPAAQAAQSAAIGGHSVADVLRDLRDGKRLIWVHADLAAAIGVLYDELWDVLGGDEDTIHLALQRRWAPAMAWDDDPEEPHWIDNPAAEVSDWRRPFRTPLTELAIDLIEILAYYGGSRELAAMRLRVSRRQIERILAAGRAS